MANYFRNENFKILITKNIHMHKFFLNKLQVYK